MERNDATLKAAALRELREELRIDFGELDVEPVLKEMHMFDQHKRANGNVTEYFYNLDVDAVLKEHPEFAEHLACEAIIRNFNASHANKTVTVENAAMYEKRDVYAVPLCHLPEQFDDDLKPCDEAAMLVPLTNLAMDICAAVDADMSDDNVTHLVDGMLEFQRSRTMSLAKAAAHTLCREFEDVPELVEAESFDSILCRECECIPCHCDGRKVKTRTCYVGVRAKATNEPIQANDNKAMLARWSFARTELSEAARMEILEAAYISPDATHPITDSDSDSMPELVEADE